MFLCWIFNVGSSGNVSFVNSAYSAMVPTHSSLKCQLEVVCSTVKVPRLQVYLAQEREHGGRFGQTFKEGDGLGYGGQRKIRV